MIAIALLYALTPAPSWAENYVVNVHGIVCELCSYGVAKKVRKLSFIDKQQFDEGVKVDIENQMVYVAVREDAQVDKELLFKAIRSGGYDPVKIWSLSESGEQQELQP